MSAWSEGRFWNNLQRPSPVPPGTRIELVFMPNDPDPVPSGTRGTVEEGSNGAQIYVKWDNGRSLTLLPGVDSYKVVSE